MVYPTQINIPAQQPPPPEPALLSTCRRIRKEARGIYYGENIFLFHIQSFDATILCRFIDRSRAHNETSRRATFSGSPNWSNLMDWLKFTHDTGEAGSGASSVHARKTRTLVLRLCAWISLGG